MNQPPKGLFERWLSLERATGRSMADILADLNAAAETRYEHNWPSVMAKRNFQMERIPSAVRRYMMRKVLEDELKGFGIDLSKSKLDKLIVYLT